MSGSYWHSQSYLDTYQWLVQNLSPLQARSQATARCMITDTERDTLAGLHGQPEHNERLLQFLERHNDAFSCLLAIVSEQGFDEKATHLRKALPPTPLPTRRRPASVTAATSTHHSASPKHSELRLVQEPPKELREAPLQLHVQPTAEVHLRQDDPPQPDTDQKALAGMHDQTPENNGILLQLWERLIAFMPEVHLRQDNPPQPEANRRPPPVHPVDDLKSGAKPSLALSHGNAKQHSRNVPVPSAVSTATTSQRVGKTRRELDEKKREERPSTCRSWQPGQPLKVQGLRNLGNTCFLNAALQCLYQTHELHQELETCLTKTVTKTVQAESSPSLQVTLGPSGGQEMTSALCDLFQDLSSSSAYSASDVKRVLAKHESRYRGYQQHDSAEALRYILEIMRSEQVKRMELAIDQQLREMAVDDSVKYSAEKRARMMKSYRKQFEQGTFVDQVFVGMMETTTTCRVQGCGHVQKSMNSFNELCLAVAIKPTNSQRCTTTPDHSAAGSSRHGLEKYSSWTQTGGRHMGTSTSPEMSLGSAAHRSPKGTGSRSSFGGSHSGYIHSGPYASIGRSQSSGLAARRPFESSGGSGHQPVDSTRVTIQDCLDLYTADEEAVGCNAFCARCDEKRQLQAMGLSNSDFHLVHPESAGNICRQYRFSRLPKVLIVTLKRFKIGRGRLIKCHDPVVVTTTLDLTSYCNEECLREGDLDKTGRIQYTPFATISHSGGISAGHYIAHVKNRRTPGETPESEGAAHSARGCQSWQVKAADSRDTARWYYVSDDHIRNLRDEEALPSEPYAVFYERHFPH